MGQERKSLYLAFTCLHGDWTILFSQTASLPRNAVRPSRVLYYLSPAGLNETVIVAVGYTPRTLRKEKFEAVLPPIRLPSGDVLLVWVTEAVPNEITGNEVDSFILPPWPVNHQFAKKLCCELGKPSPR
jgi:hypothetical protein